MIEVGNTGLYFDDGHKGCLKIYMEHNDIFRNDFRDEYMILNGNNADSSCEVFKAILENASWNINGERFLKNHEWLIKECLKEQNRHQSRMCQCWECGLHSQCSYPPMMVNADWSRHYVSEIPECEYSVLSADSPVTYLKDLDLRSEYIYGLHMICKIKSIKNPGVYHGKYKQECTFYGNDTSKTIDVILEDGVAEYDKWNKEDTVEAWGIFRKGLFYVTSMNLIEEDTSEPVVINRNVETPGYNDWRNTIINRDKKCVCCGHNKHLEAHHLFGYKENPSLAINESNGVTLCKFCHDKYHRVYGLKNINPVDFMNFIKRFGVR